MERKTNPYDWINPVSEKDIFAGRREELSVIRDEVARLANKSGVVPIIGMTGERRVGKSSILNRIKEICKELSIICACVCIEDTLAENSWEFWHELFSRLLIRANEEKILTPYDAGKKFGYLANIDQKIKEANRAVIQELWFPEAYMMQIQRGISRVPGYVIEHDFKAINDAFNEIGNNGSVILLDEAHRLIESDDIKQQLLHTIQHDKRSGLIFAGQSPLGRMFSEESEPFFNQAKVIPIKNFIEIDDVAECALLPLSSEERKLISPMTIDYLAKLSQGKPNLIRLICCAIYNRYLKGSQENLDINIDVLDDVLDCVAQSYEDPELRERIIKIEKLDSVDFEILNNMTRYPNWSVQDVIDLDESFRGENRSTLSEQRRKNTLEKKKASFVEKGILIDKEDKYVLNGGEFIALYIRFLHEVLNYGRLSRKLAVGKGPTTVFGEKTEKLVRAFAYNLGQSPELRRFIFHSYDRDYGDVIAQIKKRYNALAEIMSGGKKESEYRARVFLECYEVCEILRKPGNYFLVCLSVRDPEHPRELIQVELYFDLEKELTVDLVELFKLLNSQAQGARVLIEGYDYFWVKLPDLDGFFIAVLGVTTVNIKKRLPLVESWKIDSIQHFINSREEEIKREKEEEEEEKEKVEWVKLYSKGEEKEAEKFIDDKLNEIGEKGERQKRARLLNDRGYIRYGEKLKNKELARRDLETALYLHFFGLDLTLLDLSIIDIDEGNYKDAIEKIENVLLLTLNREDLDVSYLRLRLPENHLGFKVKWEQHPANIIEASYVNLAYATIKLEGYKKACDIVNEGLEIIPSSIRLKHTMARVHLYNKRADKAYPFYQELAGLSKLPDEGILVEIKILGRKLRI